MISQPGRGCPGTYGFPRVVAQLGRGCPETLVIHQARFRLTEEEWGLPLSLSVRKFASRISLSIRTSTPRAQGYPAFSRARNKRERGPIGHPTPLGWGGVANWTNRSQACAKSIALVGHYTPLVPLNREEIVLGHMSSEK